MCDIAFDVGVCPYCGCSYRFGEIHKCGVMSTTTSNKVTIKPNLVYQSFDIELKIRRDVLNAVGNIWQQLETMRKGQPIDIVKDMEIIKDRLYLLWGE